MTELLPNIFTFPIPLKDNPLRAINCYVVKGAERSLIIDTSFNDAEGWQIMQDSLAELGIPIESADVFITHEHVDHIGLISKLKRESNHIFTSKVDGERIHSMHENTYWEYVTAINSWVGMPEEYHIPYTDHVFYTMRHDGPLELTYVNPDQTLCYGGYEFTVMDFSGHSPGQIGLWEKTANILFCGDHILGNISPNVAAWGLETRDLETYLKNLERLKGLGIKHTFTAHRELPQDIESRIDELVSHHNQRLEEVREILRHADHVNAYETAKGMTWSYRTTFAEFPVMQKWFAGNEALAHLQYLYFTGEAERVIENETPYFSLVKSV